MRTSLATRSPVPRTKSVLQRSAGTVSRSGVEDVLHLQRTTGNRAVTRLLRSATARSIHRQPAQKARSKRSSEQLTSLAKSPGHAHLEWKKLSTEEKATVVEQMAQRYGAKFAAQFRDVADRGTADRTLHYSQPGMGPTPAQLTSRGWHFWEMEVTGNAAYSVEVWVHPSGQTFRRDVSPQTTPKAPQPEVPPPPPPEKTCEEKLNDLLERLWRTMAEYEAAVEAVEANPQDRAKLDAEVTRTRNLTRGLTDELSKLQTAADDEGDEECADKASEAWSDAMEQLTTIAARYNGIP